MILTVVLSIVIFPFFPTILSFIKSLIVQLIAYNSQSYSTEAPIDSLWLEVKIAEVKMLISGLYRPGNTTNEDVNTQMIHTIKTAYALSNLTFILGDFNYPNINWKNLTLSTPDKKTQDFLNMYQETNVHQMINFPTRYRNSQSSLLDLFLCNDQSSVFNLKPEPPVGRSDHVVITAKVQLRIPPKPTHKALRRDFYRADYEKINNFMALQRFDTGASKFANFEKTIKMAIEHYIPLKRVKLNQQKPWIGPYLFREINKKRRLWDCYKSNKTQEKYEAYRIQNNALKKKLNDARRKYENGLATSDSPKRLFKYISRNLNSKVSIINVKDPDSGEFLDNKSLAESFAAQFDRCFSQAQSLPIPVLPDHGRVQDSIESVAFTQEKVERVIGNMKADSSPGPDGIPTIMLKKCCSTVSSILTDVMQECVNTGRIPMVWKESIVTPLFKKGDRHKVENYRPISLTCNPLKCMEKIIVEELTAFFLEHNLIPPSQHGFMPKRSTTTNLLECLDDWTTNHDNSEPTDVIYLDYEKAFDKVPHSLLLLKLEHYGVRGKLLTLIADTLNNRHYQVRVNGELSSRHVVRSGVVQGSVLGPLLFTSYLFDLVCLVHSSMKLFADDCKIYANPLRSLDQLRTDLQNVQDWSTSWGMKLNESKCTVLRIGLNNPNEEYVLNNTTLATVTKQNDLGVIVSSDLKWENHVVKVTKKANSFVFLVQQAFKDHSAKMILHLYKSFIRPKLEYAFVVWNPYFVKDIELLERVQRRITKIPPELKNLPYTERLARLNLTSLRERRHRGDLIETFKITSGYYQCNISNIYHKSQNQNLRGHSQKLEKEKAAKLPRKNFIVNRIVYSWNSLREESVSATNTNVFKNRIDTELRENATRMVHYSV